MITESSKGAFHHYNSTPAASITGVATVLSLKTHLNMFTNDIIPHFLISTLLLNYREIVRGENKQKNPKTL